MTEVCFFSFIFWSIGVLVISTFSFIADLIRNVRKKRTDKSKEGSVMEEMSTEEIIQQHHQNDLIRLHNIRKDFTEQFYDAMQSEMYEECELVKEQISIIDKSIIALSKM